MIIFISWYAIFTVVILVFLLLFGVIDGLGPLFEWIDENLIIIQIIVLVLAIIVTIAYTHYRNVGDDEDGYPCERGSAGALGYINRILLVPPVVTVSISWVLSILSDFNGESFLYILFIGTLLFLLSMMIAIIILGFVYFIAVGGSNLIYVFTGKIGLIIYTVVVGAIEFYFLYRWEFLPFAFLYN